MKQGIHCYIEGKVQGVWFRASTKEQAILLGLTGWVRNLPDGRVEVMACGEHEQLTALHAWLSKGPPKAEVSSVNLEKVEWTDFDGFKTL